MRLPFRVWAQYLLPQRLLAALVYHAARCRWPALKRPLIRWFAARYAIDLDEAEHSDVEAYESFNAFFARALKAGARPIEGDEHTVISPVDGHLMQFGTAGRGVLVQAKGLSYPLDELVGESGSSAARLRRGDYVTLYLAPGHYHRVHLPLAGTLTRTRYIPGARFSVDPTTASVVPRLFCRNERVVCWFETAAGPLVLVLVGALNVSSISTRWLGEIASGAPRVWDEGTGTRRRFGRGDEVGAFNLGSTVILILPPGRLTWREGLHAGRRLNMGEALGALGPAPGA